MGNQYEIVMVYDSDLDEDGVRAQIDKLVGILQAHEGTVKREELLGRQQLSYPMKKKSYGSYVILVAEAAPTFVADFTRQMRITDEVLRFSVVKKDKFAPDFVKRTEERSTSRKSRDDRDKSDSKSKETAAKPAAAEVKPKAEAATVATAEAPSS